MDGLELIAGNQVTRGVLHLKYDVNSLVAINWNDSTVTTVKLPRELNAFAADGSLLKYISSASFSYSSATSHTNHEYTAREMYIEKDTQTDDTYLLKFDNPAVSGIGLNVQMHVEFDLDLGEMVTETGTRIPDAYDKSAYHLASTISSKNESIDWELVGNTNGTTTIPVWQLDPGYDILKQAPTIHNPVYDTDTVVTGSGIPGATVTLRQGIEADSPILGTAVVDPSGVYSITIPKQNAGVTILATQNAGFGDGAQSTAVVQHKSGALPAPKVPSTITIASKSISGTGTPGNVITMTNKRTGQEITATVQSNGAFFFSIPDGFWSQYDIISFVESNSAGDVSPESEVIVIP